MTKVIDNPKKPSTVPIAEEPQARASRGAPGRRSLPDRLRTWFWAAGGARRDGILIYFLWRTLVAFGQIAADAIERRFFARAKVIAGLPTGVSLAEFRVLAGAVIECRACRDRIPSGEYAAHLATAAHLKKYEVATAALMRGTSIDRGAIAAIDRLNERAQPVRPADEEKDDGPTGKEAR